MKMSPLWMQLQFSLDLEMACSSGCDREPAQEVRARWSEENWKKLTPSERQLCVSVVSALEQASKTGS